MQELVREVKKWPVARALSAAVWLALALPSLPVVAAEAAAAVAAGGDAPGAVATPPARPAAGSPAAGAAFGVASADGTAAPLKAATGNTGNNGKASDAAAHAADAAAANGADAAGDADLIPVPAAPAEQLYQFKTGQAPELQQFSGRPWWDILSFCSGAMMAIKTEPEAQPRVQEEAMRRLTLTLLPLLKQTGQPVEQWRGMSAKYAQGLTETRFLRDEGRRAGVMQVCLRQIPAQFRREHPVPPPL